MSTKALLIVTALIEVGTGVALLVVPSLTVELLLGEGFSDTKLPPMPMDVKAWDKLSADEKMLVARQN